MVAWLFRIGLIIAVFLTFSSIAQAQQQPTQEEIRTAVSNYFKNNFVPKSWVNHLAGGINTQISSIEVVKVGIYNQDQKYWPIMVRVVGTCRPNTPLDNRQLSFDQVGDFRFFRNDYGYIVAQLNVMY